MLGGAAAALTAIGLFIRLLVVGAARLLRIHDNIMGDGNGKKPLREVLEHQGAVMSQHMKDDHEFQVEMRDYMEKR